MTELKKIRKVLNDCFKVVETEHFSMSSIVPMPMSMPLTTIIESAFSITGIGYIEGFKITIEREK